MMNWKRILAMTMVVGGMFTVQSFAAEATAVPTPTKISVDGDVIEKTVYNINGKNYFKLRDMGSIAGYGVEWDEKNKTTNVILGADTVETQNEIGSVGKTAESVTAFIRVVNPDTQSERSYRSDLEGRLAEVPGYNIDGYTYFAIRDIAKLVDASCEWDGTSRMVSFQKGQGYIQRADEVSLPSDIEEKIAEMKRAGNTYFEVKENDVVYLADSGIYDDLAAYIKENINGDFDSKDYAVRESKTTDGIPLGTEGAYRDNAFPANASVTFRYVVGGCESTFGYKVSVYGGAAKFIQQLGEWNPAVEGRDFKPRYTEEEALQVAMEVGTSAIQKHIQNNVPIKTFFDMQDMEFKYYFESDFTIEGVLHNESDIFLKTKASEA